MSKRALILLTVCFLVGAGLPLPGNALPFGSQLVEQNGLSWLSPIWSRDISYSDMTNRVNNLSSVYYGLRIATVFEVVDLINSLPLVHPSLPSPFSVGLAIDDSQIYGPTMGMLDPFFNQFGWYELGVSPDYHRLLGGYSWDPVGQRIMGVGIEEYDIYGGLFSADHFEAGFFAFEKTSTTSYYGTWLIKPIPNPEPSTLFLLGSGLAALVWHGRRRKKA